MEGKLKLKYDVIVVGGGITGAGTARDCALRGLSVLLVERYDFTHGATGRNHGLLHSGARYAVTDQESATECIQENMILRRIARHCVEETDGLFITLPDDDLAYQQTFVSRCREAGIRADIIDPEEAKRLEPAVNPSLIGAVRVPDASVDPFRLTMANVLDARLHGADVLNYHEVVGLLIHQTRVEGVKLRNNISGETFEVRADLTINAAGVWGMLVAKMAGATVNMFPAKGALLIFGHRVNQMVINRCRKPANADILVPDDVVCVIGTTSDRVPIETCDDMRVTPQEVEVLLQEGVQLAPALAHTRILRAYAGVRPLVASDADPSGRSISRGIVTLDHATRDGIDGLITITGGKMMTYRLMAEMITDLAAKKLGNTAKCVTAEQPLPGSEVDNDKKPQTGKHYNFSMLTSEGRHGTLSPVDGNTPQVCECEGVSVEEAEYAINELHVNNLVNLRRRTRVGMGTCQGHLCACRAAGMLCQGHHAAEAAADLADFLNERWKGIKPVAWGQAMAESQLTAMVYEDLCGLNQYANQEGGIK